MKYMPAFVATDLTKVIIACLLLHYVRRMEAIKCLEYDSWKPAYIKLYAILTLVLVTISLFSTRVGLGCECNWLCMVAGIVLGVILIYAVYTHVRELEDNFYRCQLSQQDENVHEFIKLYSLLLIICLVFVAVMVVSTLVASTLSVPKYMAMQLSVNKVVAAKKKSDMDAKRNRERRLVRRVANEVQRREDKATAVDAARARQAITGKSGTKSKKSGKGSKNGRTGKGGKSGMKVKK